MPKLQPNIKVTVTMPQDWKEAAQNLAAERGLSLSELLRELIRQELPEESVNELSKPQKQGRQMQRSTWKVKIECARQTAMERLKPWKVVRLSKAAMQQLPDGPYVDDDTVLALCTNEQIPPRVRIPFGDPRMSGSVNQCADWIAEDLRKQILANR